MLREASISTKLVAVSTSQISSEQLLKFAGNDTQEYQKQAQHGNQYLGPNTCPGQSTANNTVIGMHCVRLVADTTIQSLANVFL